jgi:hypothetical protein
MCIVVTDDRFWPCNRNERTRIALLSFSSLRKTVGARSSPITADKRLERNSAARLNIRASRPPESALRPHARGNIERVGGSRTMSSEGFPNNVGRSQLSAVGKGGSLAGRSSPFERSRRNGPPWSARTHCRIDSPRDRTRTRETAGPRPESSENAFQTVGRIGPSQPTQDLTAPSAQWLRKKILEKIFSPCWTK